MQMMEEQIRQLENEIRAIQNALLQGYVGYPSTPTQFDFFTDQIRTLHQRLQLRQFMIANKEEL